MGSFNGRAPSNFNVEIIDLETLMAGGAPALAKPQGGRRARRRAKAKALQTSLLAPILAAEGCMTVRGEDTALFTTASLRGGVPGRGDDGPTSPKGPKSPPKGKKNDEPAVAANDDTGFEVETDGELLISADQLLANDLPIDNGPLTVVRVFNAVNGSVELVGDQIRFIPAPGFEGQASFEYEVQATDGAMATATVTIDVAPADDAPPPPADDTADANDDDGYEAPVDGELHIPIAELLANDTAPAGETIEITSVFNAVNGTVMLHGDAVHFTPDPGFEGMASFEYEITASDGSVSTAQVSIHVGDHGGEEDGGGHGGDDGHPHPDDPDKAEEHIALFNLVPVAEATHIAVADGSWFDPAIWANGEVPGAGAKVVIPDGIAVAYDGESDVSLFTVRVDGALNFATDVNTLMEVDTLVVSGAGELTIGTIDNPVDANVQSIIRIADNGPIDVAWDPMLLSRGVISHGDIQIHGAEKEAFLRVATDPMAGDTSITFETAPDGWEVGDKIVLAGTHLVGHEYAAPDQPRNATTQDEELVITRIEGNTVYFDTPLQYNHDAPRADLKTYAANYSRNVRIETENADDVPVHQRGHVMFMHSDNIDVRYAEFFELGRTDKSERAFDFNDVESTAADTNLKGRYAVHIHRAGVAEQDDPAMLVGNAVWGSPGWGFVHHDSHAILADNAAYDVFGAAFVSETGNETGRWVHNIAIKSIGIGGDPKWQPNVDAFDLGRTGAGFWFQSRLVDSVDNVAAGVPGGQGFVYFHRGPDGSQINVEADSLLLPETIRYHPDALIYKPNISQFEGNEAFAVDIGLQVVKATPKQGHDVRSIIKDFTAWETAIGIELQYTAHYTLQNIDLIGTRGEFGAIDEFGIRLYTLTFDVTVNGARIEGYNIGVEQRKNPLDEEFFGIDGQYQYVYIDTEIIGATTDITNLTGHDRILTSADLSTAGLSFQSDVAPFTVLDHSLDLSGVKTDSLGDAIVGDHWDRAIFDGLSLRDALYQEGYWTLPDGRIVTVFEQYVADRVTGELQKIAIFVEPGGSNFHNAQVYYDNNLPYNGVLDVNSLAPVGGADFATVAAGSSVTIDVLANDYDPDGDDISVDGLIGASNGSIHQNEDGTITYTPDPGFSGVDEFSYWVEDEHANFTQVTVQVTVEI